jgi:hypothetical protein
MRHYGHLNLSTNELQNAVLPIDTYFPTSPKVGQLVFKGKVLYICVEIQNDLPIWAPLTQEINTYVHNQNDAANSWVISHPLNSTIIQVQVFSSEGKMVIPNEVVMTNKDTVTVEFGTPFAGRAVLMIGSSEGAGRPTYGFEHTQTVLSTTWTATHNLGYHPLVRVFIGAQEVQPAQIIHDSVNETRVIFNSPYVGYAKFM